MFELDTIDPGRNLSTRIITGFDEFF